MSAIERIMKDLPPELQQEVEDFAAFVLERHAKRPRRKPKFDWAGALEDMKDEYTSVELQHKISHWRVGEE